MNRRMFLRVTGFLVASLALSGCGSTGALKTDSEPHLVQTAAGTRLADDLIIIEDFEAASYGQWTTEGDAFGKGPREEGMVGALGSRFAASTGRSGVGTLTSPPFTIERNAIYFLVGCLSKSTVLRRTWRFNFSPMVM